MATGMLCRACWHTCAYMHFTFRYLFEILIYLNVLLQVDLLTPTEVTGVVTQGSENSDSYVTSYKVQYSNNLKSFYTIQENGVDKVSLSCFPSIYRMYFLC